MTFLQGARRLLSRALLVLLAALAVTVFARQLVDSGEDEVARRPDAAPGPNLGDHWHAAYQVFICGERQPAFPQWQGGVHTHADGVIHIHPVIVPEQDNGASLVRWFQYGGGRLTEDEMRMPGDARTFHSGDGCPDGSRAVLQVFVNGDRLDDWSGYIPRDGDRIDIVFGPDEEGTE